MEAERARAWSPGETEQFTTKIDELAQAMGPEWHPEFDDIIDRARSQADTNVALPERSPTIRTSAQAGSHSPIPPATPSHVTRSRLRAAFPPVEASPSLDGRTFPPPETPPPGPPAGRGPAKGR